MAGLKRLSEEQLARYERTGVVFPIAAIPAADMAGFRRQLEEFLARHEWPLDLSTRHNPHFYLKWASELVHHPAVLDAVEDLLGPDILAWRSAFFVKRANDPGFIDWHQDATYWDLTSEELITAWVALTDCTVENGCLQVVEGSHAWPQLAHRNQRGGTNRLIRGQVVAVDVPADRVRNVELRAGEIALFHLRMVHGSAANASGTLRCGLAIRYLHPRCYPKRNRAFATLVRGVDGAGNFEHVRPPRYDYDPQAMAWHARSLRGYGARFLRDTLLHPTPERLRVAARILRNELSLPLVRKYLTGSVSRRRASPGGGR